MTVFIIRRLIQSALVILVVIALVFIGIYMIGNPVDVLIDQDAEKVDFDRMVAMLGLDRPLWEQFAVYLGNLPHWRNGALLCLR